MTNALDYVGLIGRQLRIQLDEQYGSEGYAAGVVVGVMDWADLSAVDVNFKDKTHFTIRHAEADRLRFWISEVSDV
jgi:hypothetical protein